MKRNKQKKDLNNNVDGNGKLLRIEFDPDNITIEYISIKKCMLQ